MSSAAGVKSLRIVSCRVFSAGSSVPLSGTRCEAHIPAFHMKKASPFREQTLFFLHTLYIISFDAGCLFAVFLEKKFEKIIKKLKKVLVE